MSNIIFQRPSNGAVRDVRELEYISALHQSTDIRSDGTISSECIRVMLISRHGVKIPREHIESVVMDDLAGDPRDSKPSQNFLDIPQLAALLMLPALAKIASSSSGQDEANHEQEKERIFGRVLRIILDDIGHHTEQEQDDGLSKEELFLTKEVLKKMFAVYGERDVCEITLQKMIEHVAGDDYDADSGGVILNRESFMRALTSDLGAYDFEWENTKSTHFSDFLTLVDGGIDEMERVAKDRKTGKTDTPDRVTTRDEESPATKLLKPGLDHMTLIDTKSAIDITTDSVKSQTFFVLLLLSTILTYLAYFAGEGIIEGKITCNGDFGCEIGERIASWLSIALIMGILGGIYMMLASAGNSADRKGRILWNLFGMVIVYVITINPFYSDLLPFTQRTEIEQLQWAPYVCVIVGVLLLIQQVFSLLRHFAHGRVDFGFLSINSTIGMKELHLKEAAACKVNGLLNHALHLHEDSSLSSTKDDPSRLFESAKSVALSSFDKRLNDMETVGGLCWTWKRLVRKELFNKEGIWFGARFITSQFAQIIGFLGFFFLLATALSIIHSELGKNQTSSFTGTLQLKGGVRSLYFNESGSFIYSESEVDDSFLLSNNLAFGYEFDKDMDMYQESTKEKTVQQILGALASSREVLLSIDATEDLINKVANGVENATGISLDRSVEYLDAFAAYEGGIMYFLYGRAKKRVTEEELRPAVIFGWVCTIIALLSILLSFIPRYVSQTLIYRSGVGISPLTDPMFANLKKEPRVVTLLFGTTFWGFMIAGMAVWFLCGGTLFLFVWSESSTYALGVVSVGIGALVSWMVKMIFLQLFQRKAFSGLHRRKPGLSNIVTVMMETWNIGLAIGFVVARTVKIFLMVCVYLGRFDTNFVAPHVTFFGLSIDDEYEAFHKDILLHETHRHPYLERLGLLYLIKIHQGPTFAKRQGSCWRLLFVLALMPWLRRYRLKDVRLTGADKKLHELESVNGKRESDADSDNLEDNLRDL